MIHVYAIVRELDDLPAMQGLGDAALERTRIDGFDVVTSRVEAETIEPSDQALVRHAQVIEALQPRSEAVLPAQFGHAFPDEEQLLTAVRRRHAQLERGLVHVRGCVEFGLRVLLPESERVDPRSIGSGREYMRVRLEQATRQRALADQIDEPLARLARASTRLKHAPPEALLTAAYLVPESVAGAFRREVLRLQALHAHLAVVCTGPWPPYSFASDPEDE